MKAYTSKQISLLISVFLTVIILVLILLDIFLTSKGVLSLIVIPVVFVSTYFSILSILKNGISPSSVKLQGEKGIASKEQQGLETEELSNSEMEEEKELEVWTMSQIKELERLKELEKYRKEFVGNVSHELKTPIFNIQGYILTLLEGGIDDTNINKLYLQRTEKSIDRMISIVEDLESITKLESGELKLRFVVFDIIKMVEDVFELDQMLANEFKITLEIENHAGSPLLVWADKKRMMEVVSNLVLNAIKYGKKKGKVTVSLYDIGEKIKVEVKDDGIGVDNKNLPRIFERFYRADKSRSREQGGTGLGLSIVKHIIEAHKQTISVKSKLNVGTTFTFTVDKTE